MAEYIKRDDALSMLDGIYDCNDMVFENDSCEGRDCASCRWYDTKKYIRGRMANLPAADVAPVRNGTWTEVQVIRIAEPVDHNDWKKGLLIHDEQRLPSAVATMRCSKCHRYHNEVYFYGNPTEMVHYCPNCGARMDGDGDGKT